MGEIFSAAMNDLRSSTTPPQRLSDPFVSVFPVSGAAVSTLGEFLGSRTISASNRTAARLDELQFDLSEGPCWDAMRTARPVLVPDAAAPSTWPAFSRAMVAEDVGAIFAFPLRVGLLQIGAVDLYSHLPLRLDAQQAREAGEMAGEVGRRVLLHALDGIGLDEEMPADGFSRRLIHQATGMVLAQLDLNADDARLVIQGHAFAADRPMMEIARDIIEGRLDFTRQSIGIEASE
jgi:hypothetical protein